MGSVERWASGALGLGLIGYGLARRSRGGLGGAAAGAMLLRRGLTGVCPVYRRLGVSSA